jgi:hypothetical protein
MTALFIPITRQRLEKAFGDYPDIIRAWEQLQGIVGGTSANSMGASISALSEQLMAAEIATHLQTKAVLMEAREYAEAVQEAGDVSAQLAFLRAEVTQLRLAVDALSEKP